MRLDWGIVNLMGGAYTTVAIVKMQASLVSQVCVSVCAWLVCICVDTVISLSTFLFLLFPVFDFPPGSLLRDLHHKTTQVFTQQAGCLHNKHTGDCSTHPAAEPRTGTAMTSSSVPSFLADVSREGKSDWVGKEVLRLNF